MKTQNPLIGRASGKFGTAVFQTQFGQNIVRTKTNSYTDRQSDEQLAVRSKFTVAQAWVIKFLSIIRIGFAEIASGMSPYSKALGYHITNAIEGSAGNYSIDYSEAMFSITDIQPVTVDASNIGTDGSSTFINLDTSILPNGIELTDYATLVIYNATTDKHYIFNNVTTFATQTGDLNNNEFSVSDVVHVYLLGYSSAQSKYSTSYYIGQESVNEI